MYLSLALETAVCQRLGNELLKPADGECLPGAGLAVGEESSDATVPGERDQIGHKTVVNLLGGGRSIEKLVNLVVGGLETGSVSVLVITLGES